MDFQLISLSGVKANEKIYSATIPTVDGVISVFPSHEPLVTLARSGIVAITYEKDADLVEYMAISGGVVEVSHDSLRILVDEAEHGDEIIEAEAKVALERAVKMRDETDDQVEREKAKQLVDRHLVRLKVAELQQRHRGRRRNKSQQPNDSE